MKQYIITLIVLLLPIDPPSVTVTPLSQVVNMSDTVTITCTVFALPPPTITWTDDRNSAIVLPGGRFSITQSDSGNTRTSILSFNGILKEDESSYTCTAVNNVTNVIDAIEEVSGQITVQGLMLTEVVVFFSSVHKIYALSYLSLSNSNSSNTPGATAKSW